MRTFRPRWSRERFEVLGLILCLVSWSHATSSRACDESLWVRVKAAWSTRPPTFGKLRTEPERIVALAHRYGLDHPGDDAPDAERQKFYRGLARTLNARGVSPLALARTLAGPRPLVRAYLDGIDRDVAKQGVRMRWNEAEARTSLRLGDDVEIAAGCLGHHAGFARLVMLIRHELTHVGRMYLTIHRDMTADDFVAANMDAELREELRVYLSERDVYYALGHLGVTMPIFDGTDLGECLWRASDLGLTTEQLLEVLGSVYRPLIRRSLLKAFRAATLLQRSPGTLHSHDVGED